MRLHHRKTSSNLPRTERDVWGPDVTNRANRLDALTRYGVRIMLYVLRHT
jgi:hypothetical protein